jgi:putative addiction module CopG family antidote
MPDLVVSLPSELDEFVVTSVESGRYASADELVQTALFALHREQKAVAEKHFASDIAEGDVFRQLWEAAPHTAFSLSRQ